MNSINIQNADELKKYLDKQGILNQFIQFAASE